MKGQILDFSLQKNGGVISGDDGNRYLFHSSEWREQTMPTRGMAVYFDINEKIMVWLCTWLSSKSLQLKSEPSKNRHLLR
mgnify:CR=1 FL=1